MSKCPRCPKGIVNKGLRRCNSCGGWVVFKGDTGLMDKLDSDGNDWYCWSNEMCHGGWGWHHSSYFRPRPMPRKY
jgi:hypothetical protein